jgi:hypothetical protein
MNVSIFGVGRSGTKAVQLYVSYCLAKHYGKIRLNYEPYHHLTRKGILNFRGITNDLRSKKIMAAHDVLDSAHANFIKSLYSKDTPTVTKFIRGNGRINQINEILNPDLTIVIVRDVYQVLASVLQMNWNFYAFGNPGIKLTYHNFINKLVEEAKEESLVEDDLLSSEPFMKANRILDNALYWYIMNKAALRNIVGPVILLKYEDISLLPGKLHRFNADVFPADVSMSNTKFIGSNIHNDTTLVSDKKRSSATKLLSVVNELGFSATSKLSIGSVYSIPLRIGDNVIINSNVKKSVVLEKKVYGRKNIIVEKNTLLDAMNSEVLDQID